MRFLVDRYLDPAHLKKQGIFHPKVVEDLVSQHMMGGRYNHWWKLWLLIVLQMWLEHWVDIIVGTNIYEASACS
ncbi:asparagine synthase-related protein [Chloroflexus sp.]|uniref:asparagine synthase-related protein n=1 Tax=Chloroflexus sp. TaxID=1904827 RepID=UPI0035B528F2